MFREKKKFCYLFAKQIAVLILDTSQLDSIEGQEDKIISLDFSPSKKWHVEAPSKAQL